MYKRKKYITAAWSGIVWLGLGLTLCGCESDEPSGETPSGSGAGRGQIVVCGGKGDLVAQTRYVGPDDETSGPQIDGTCYADQLEIYPFFISSGFTTGWPDANQYDRQPGDGSTITVPSPVPLEIMGRNCCAEAQINIAKTHDYIYMYHTALAYTQSDRAKFTAAIANRTTSTIAIVGSGTTYSTPELYYGVLHLKDGSYDPSASGAICRWETNSDNADEMFWFHISKDNGSASLEGRIFRIVSQVNLTITDVPAQNVRKIDLFTDNYPLQITLNGNHGSFYPVSAVTDLAHTTATDSVLLASADISESSNRITLSSFLLPSEVGMHLWIGVTYKNGKVKTFDLRPQTSHYLTGNDALVYNVGDDLRNGSDLYVYDGNGGKFCFYTYANVRVNMSGRYDNIAVDTGDSNITIEVNPNFEDLHQFEIK